MTERPKLEQGLRVELEVYKRELRVALGKLEWSPLYNAPRDGSYVELRMDSHYKGYPYEVVIAKYDADYEKSAYTQPWNDKTCWRTVAGDRVFEDGCAPTHWRQAS